MSPGNMMDNSPAGAERTQQAGSLVAEAIALAERNGPARRAAVRGAAALLPRLNTRARDMLAPRWMKLAQSPSVPRTARLDAYSAFFDVAARADAVFARRMALMLPDAAARAGAFIDLSEATETANWTQSGRDIAMAQQAARREPNLTQRARALTFVAYRLANIDSDASAAAVAEASSQARLVGRVRERDYLLAEIVGAAAKTDLILARRVAANIVDTDLKGLADARINLAQISQTTLTASTADRVAALAKAAARYDMRAIPILIQLPPQPDVLKSLSDALPPIYPTARPAVDAALLERIWRYAGSTAAGAQRDELQSRLARLMVLHDLWRGRDWGKQLAWRGGRIQVGAFLKNVAAARRSQVRAAPLQDLAERNINRAVAQARTLPPASRVEALLLIAGQLLE